MKVSPRRGDLVRVILDPARGTASGKTIPAVVISNNSCNAYGARVVVVPVTSNVDSLYPGEARIRVRGQPARALGDQTRSLDKSRLRARIGRLDPEELAALEDAVLVTLGIQKW